jgi:GNAT superfamily N-acetyltransferase
MTQQATEEVPSTIHKHHLTGKESKQTIKHGLDVLRPHLPVCLPLYRRLQFGRFFDATVLLTNISDLERRYPEQDSLPEHWLLAFVDRSCRPETEVWLYASWEDGPTTANLSVETDELLHSLLRAMKDLGAPPSIHGNPTGTSSNGATDTDSAGLSRSDYGGHAADPNVMLWGSIHERTVRLLQDLGVLTTRFKAAIVPNHCFIWQVDSMKRYDQRALPAGLKWGELQREHFELVRSRTAIPRQDRTLAVLANLGIFHEKDEPVSWAFVGLDSSLTTLHVEPEYRGQGLAKAITTKLFREKMDLFWEDGHSRQAHGYVIDGNKESEGMCRSLGGSSRWQVYWLRVDLQLVQ